MMQKAPFRLLDINLGTKRQGLTPCVRLQAKPEAAAETTTEPAKTPTWPKSMPDQVEAVRRLLAIGHQTPEALASHFKRRPTKSITQVLAALQILGQAQQAGEVWRLA